MPERGPPLRWRRPEELLEVGLARSKVVMVNEAHSGLRRSIRTREVGRGLVHSAHGAGVRSLAMEALSPGFAAEANRTRAVPQAALGYLAQPDMRRLIQAALDHDFTLVAYEADLSKRPAGLEALSQADTNWREEEQARQLGEAVARLPDGARLLVWCGNGHLTRHPVGDWRPMGYMFEQLTGIEPFTIDQIRTVEFGADLNGRRSRPPGADWAVQFAPVLKSLGGTAGFLAEEAPRDWSAPGKSGAFLVSTDNALE